MELILYNKDFDDFEAKICGVIESVVSKEKNSIPLEIIQKILSHSDIRITQIYAQVYDDVIQKEMSKLKY